MGDEQHVAPEAQPAPGKSTSVAVHSSGGKGFLISTVVLAVLLCGAVAFALIMSMKAGEADEHVDIWEGQAQVCEFELGECMATVDEMESEEDEVEAFMTFDGGEVVLDTEADAKTLTIGAYNDARYDCMAIDPFGATYAMGVDGLADEATVEGIAGFTDASESLLINLQGLMEQHDYLNAGSLCRHQDVLYVTLGNNRHVGIFKADMSEAGEVTALKRLGGWFEQWYGSDGMYFGGPGDEVAYAQVYADAGASQWRVWAYDADTGVYDLIESCGQNNPDLVEGPYVECAREYVRNEVE